MPTDSVDISHFDLDAPLLDALHAHGIERFYPPQAAAVGPVMAGHSVLLACPTASGKSLVAYLALLRAARAGRTGLYLVPLRALAQEKYEELQQFADLGVKVGISIGDFDLPASALEKLDILVATSEKADGLLRRGSPWLERLGTVVADEVHLMRDPDRGPTLEVTLTRLRRANPDLQIVALSATVGNSMELAEWLGADHIASEFRPVPLRSGVYHEGRITFTDLSVRPIPGPGEPLPRLVRTVIQDGGQALVFVSTRRGSEQAAQALAGTVLATLSPSERAAAQAAREELFSVSEEETEGIRRLGHLLPSGVAFHNASLTNPERRVVEKGVPRPGPESVGRDPHAGGRDQPPRPARHRSRPEPVRRSHRYPGAHPGDGGPADVRPGRASEVRHGRGGRAARPLPGGGGAAPR